MTPKCVLAVFLAFGPVQSTFAAPVQIPGGPPVRKEPANQEPEPEPTESSEEPAAQQDPEPQAEPQQDPEPQADPATRDGQTPAASDTPQGAINPLAPGLTQQDGGLPRRVRTGLSFSETSDGLHVEAVAPRSAAETAGFLPGDVIKLIDASPAADRNALLWRLRRARAGEPIRFEVLRGPDAVELVLYADEAVREGDLDSTVEYGAIQGTKGRLRTVLAVPRKGLSTLRPAVLIIRGVGSSPVDGPGNNAYRELAFALARSGVVSLRYDPSGVGDSEGPENYSVDFTTEVEDARAALASLRADSRIDPEQIFVLGTGTGGGVAAVLASSESGIRALAVVGTIARPLFEYVLDSRRQQAVLAGLSPAEVDEVLKQHITVFSRLMTGGRPQRDEYGIVAADQTVFGKDVAYWRQYDSVNFGKLFSELKIPVLNAIGEYDFVSTLNDHRVIADALRVKGGQEQVLVVLDRADHDLRLFDSREAAYTGFDSPDAPVNDRALGSIVTWVQAHERKSEAVPETPADPQTDPPAEPTPEPGQSGPGDQE